MKKKVLQMLIDWVFQFDYISSTDKYHFFFKYIWELLVQHW